MSCAASAEASANESPESTQARPFQAQAETQRNVERAVASLAARQRRIERDRQIAQAIADLAAAQQQAREDIAEQASKLDDLASKANQSGQPMHATTPEQQAAAKALQDAQQTFAEAQRATGEGAAEISGQNEVANEPIRAGLEAASQLQPPPSLSETELATRSVTGNSRRSI